MTPEFLTILLWVPFILTLVAFAVPYCAKGFKKGLWHALVSLGATAIAAVVSFFGAKMLAPVFLSKATVVLPELSFEENAVLDSFLSALMEGLITGLVSLALFSGLLLILSLVCKLLLSLIPVPKGEGLFRIFGMALRFADAVVLTVLLLLPLYGTLAAYGPSLNAVMEYVTSSEDPIIDPELEGCIHSAVEHPLVKLSGSKPCAAIYNGLAAVETDIGKINVPEMIQTVSQASGIFSAMTDGDFTVADIEALADLPKDIANEDWFYAAFSAASETIKPTLEELGEDAPTALTALQQIAELPKESFAQCYTGLVDWVSFASEEGLFQAMEDGTLDTAQIMESGLVQKTLEIQETMPEDFPFFNIVLQFFRDYMG